MRKDIATSAAFRIIHLPSNGLPSIVNLGSVKTLHVGIYLAIPDRSAVRIFIRATCLIAILGIGKYAFRRRWSFVNGACN